MPQIVSDSFLDSLCHALRTWGDSSTDAMGVIDKAAREAGLWSEGDDAGSDAYQAGYFVERDATGWYFASPADDPRDPAIPDAERYASADAAWRAAGAHAVGITP